MAFTVVPLHNLDLPFGTVIPFGKFAIQDVPQWLLKEPILDRLSEHNRDGVHRAKQALVSEYEAPSYGHPDPEWIGAQPKGIQDLRWQAASLANMSIWMVMPSPVCITCGFHTLTSLGGRQLERPVVNHIDRETTLFCHERDFHNAPTVSDLKKSARLFETLSTVSRKNAVWPALRAFWAALTSYPGDLRYPLYWQGLESLFGSEDEVYGVSKRLRDRISYFLADNAKDQQDLHDKVRSVTLFDLKSSMAAGRIAPHSTRFTCTRPRQSSEPLFGKLPIGRVYLACFSRRSETIFLRRGFNRRPLSPLQFRIEAKAY